MASANLDTQLTAIDDYIDSEVSAIKAKTDQLTFTTANQVDAQTMSIAAAAIQAIWDRLTSALTTVGSIGKLLVDNINATISSRASQTSLDTLDDYVDTEVAAIKAKTDNLPADPADASDIASSFTTVNGKLDTIDDFLDTEIAAIKAKTDNLPAAPAATGDIPTAGAIADAVWDEDATPHQTQGTFGQTIGSPGGNNNTIWATINANLDATVSSRATQTSLDTLDDYVDTEVAAIKAKTDNLPSDPADQSAVEAAITAATGTTATKVDELHKFRGLSSGNPWTVTETSEDAGGVTVNFTGDGETTSTATRV
jgi:hypothetical protein